MILNLPPGQLLPPIARFYARQQNASRVFAIIWASVRPSVTLVICIKTVQARITKSSLWLPQGL